MTGNAATVARISVWDEFPRRRAALAPPLRPDDTVRAAVRKLLPSCSGPGLLLGVTPEFCDFSDLIVDWSANMLRAVRPKNTATRRVQADWLKLPCQTATASTAVGDGSLSCLRYPAEYRDLFDELARVLRPGGRIIIRTFLRPETGETLSEIRERTRSGDVRSVHALKWLLAHALCAVQQTPNVRVSDIYQAFAELFADRAGLKRATGWQDADLAAIDAFAVVAGTFSFPTAGELRAILPSELSNGARFVPSGAYELADRCPLLVMERA